MRALRGAMIAAVVALAAPAEAAEAEKPPAHGWSFEGVFGSYDEAALQRGFRVYEEVCSSCHGVRFLKFRNLHGIYPKDPPKGVTEEEYKKLVEGKVKAIAAEYEVEDLDDEGEVTTRPARPADPIPVPFANEKAARAANNGALPPDLSLITKARKGGADYLYAILIGYEEEVPGDCELGEGMNYNRYFPGCQIAMPPPLFEDAVEYTDGTKASVAQMAEDVTQFLMWAAEPTLEVRKRIGIKAMLFLIVLTALFYASKRKIWTDVH